MGITLEVDFKNAEAVSDVFLQAAAANLQTAGRAGSLVDLPSRGRLLITGDIHDHRDHFDKALKLASLDTSANHHLLLQELIHGDRLINNMDLSYRLLARAALLKAQRPDQVHIILSNHELAQVRNEGILKDSISVVEAFNDGLDYVFGDDAPQVQDAIRAFVESMPLAVRRGENLLLSHSLPAPRKLAEFDPSVLHRIPTPDDMSPTGSAHLLVWGRNLTQKLADELGEHWEVDLFILGHQHAEMGYEECGRSMLIVNSDHSHGIALPIDLHRHYSRDELIESILPLAAVL
jgi:hypothetical protein